MDKKEPCKYCSDRYSPLYDNNNGGDVKIINNELCIDSFMRCSDCNNASQFYAEIKINYCPMCGRKLNIK